MSYLRPTDDPLIQKRHKKQKGDPQAHLVYSAENKIKPYHCFRSENAARAFIREVVHSRWWKARFPHIQDVAMVVQDRDRGYADAMPGFKVGAVRLDWTYLSQDNALHELAHTIVEGGKPKIRPNATVHGKEFAGTYLALLRKFTTQEYYLCMRDCFETGGVEFLEPDVAEGLWRK